MEEGKSLTITLVPLPDSYPNSRDSYRKNQKAELAFHLMTMPSKKIITVFGATGLQGGSVASKFLVDKALSSEWTVRAVTRDISKPAAQKLAEQGAEVVTVSISSDPWSDNSTTAFAFGSC